MTVQDIPAGYMKNAQGALIPEANVRPEDKLEDQLVRGLVDQALRLNTALADFKVEAMSEAAEFKKLIAEKYGASKGGAGGNMTLSSFDGSMQVQVAVSNLIDLHTPQLAAAKELIDECVIRWSDGANDNLKALVDHAFQVNKQGKIDTQRVLGLTKLEISDDQWNRAMDAIRDAVKVTATRTYIRFYQTDVMTGLRSAISLDLASV